MISNIQRRLFFVIQNLNKKVDTLQKSNEELQSKLFEEKTKLHHSNLTRTEITDFLIFRLSTDTVTLFHKQTGVSVNFNYHGELWRNIVATFSTMNILLVAQGYKPLSDTQQAQLLANSGFTHEC